MVSKMSFCIILSNCPLCSVAKKIGVTTRNYDDIPDEDSDVKEERMKVEEMFESDQVRVVEQWSHSWRS